MLQILKLKLVGFFPCRYKDQFHDGTIAVYHAKTVCGKEETLVSCASFNCQGKVWTSIARDHDELDCSMFSSTSAGGATEAFNAQLSTTISNGIWQSTWTTECYDAFVHGLSRHGPRFELCGSRDLTL